MSVGLFLDRDGVINAKAPEGRYITDWADFQFLPGVVGALARIRDVAPDAVVVVVTNQRGVARGAVASATVDDIHARMRDQLRAAGADVDAIEVCPHETGTCDCRKPALGLFRRAMADFPSIDGRARPWSSGTPSPMSWPGSISARERAWWARSSGAPRCAARRLRGVPGSTSRRTRWPAWWPMIASSTGSGRRLRRNVADHEGHARLKVMATLVVIAIVTSLAVPGSSRRSG